MKRNDSVRVWSIMVGLAVLTLLVGALLDGNGLAIAQGGDEPAAQNMAEPPELVAVPDPEPHNPFEQYPAGDGSIAFEELAPAEQTGVMVAAERTYHGHEVHARWSKVARARAAEAKRIKAAYKAGVQGLDEVGVD